jgi:hypothetical protein
VLLNSFHVLVLIVLQFLLLDVRDKALKSFATFLDVILLSLSLWIVMPILGVIETRFVPLAYVGLGYRDLPP